MPRIIITTIISIRVKPDLLKINLTEQRLNSILPPPNPNPSQLASLTFGIVKYWNHGVMAQEKLEDSPIWSLLLVPHCSIIPTFHYSQNVLRSKSYEKSLNFNPL
jgi:hypothetical protein